MEIIILIGEIMKRYKKKDLKKLILEPPLSSAWQIFA
jgi:hypothetical protein